jgi:N-acetyltransferase
MSKVWLVFRIKVLQISITANSGHPVRDRLRKRCWRNSRLNTDLELRLQGSIVELLPLDRKHVPALVEAAAVEPSLYRWTPVPQGLADMQAYVDTALAWKEAGTAVPFSILRKIDGSIIGSTRFWNIEYWAWPHDHKQARRSEPDACEIGYTWLTQSAVRTGVNTQIKRMMLAYAFEVWNVVRVCLHTDERNERSRAAIERIGGKFEGVLRAHKLAADLTPRNSCRYSILIEEWPEVKSRIDDLQSRFRRPTQA